MYMPPTQLSAPGFATGFLSRASPLRAEYACASSRAQFSLSPRRAKGHPARRPLDPAMERHDLLDFGAGYIQRSIDELPKRGEAWPWCPRMYYVSDLLSIRHGALVDSAMEFRRPHAKPD